ncbi:MAG: amidohydrolase family protein [Candidatus Competibacterales bacterium]
MSDILFQNAQVLDTERGVLCPNTQVLVRAGRIVEVSEASLSASGARSVDLQGRVLMPGLCDAHVHVIAITADFARLERSSPFYVAAKASDILRGMLLRGFTTVRDAGGCDHGLAQAVEEDLLPGPRILFCGRALSQTGGHGDMRSPGENSLNFGFPCAGLGVVCDGVPEVRRAARDQLRKGAHQIKIMASGGVASPTDRIDSTQFADEEIRAVVEEATAAHRYVMAHAYTARAINRAVRLGVRTIEHGNLLDEESCRLMNHHGAYLVPTLATYHALAEEGVAGGLAPDLIQKLDAVLEAGTAALKLAFDHRVPMVYGSDLLGEMHRRQLDEFNLRKGVIPAPDLIRAATCTAAEALMRPGEFGVICEGARADLLVVEGDPLTDITVLTQPQHNLLAVVKEGRFYKNRLPSAPPGG